MKKVFIILLLFFLSISLGANSQKASVLDCFYSKDIDITSKSYLGWIRVLNNDIKRKEYKLDDLNQKEVELYVQQLKELSKSNSFKGKLK